MCYVNHYNKPIQTGIPFRVLFKSPSVHQQRYAARQAMLDQARLQGSYRSLASCPYILL